MKAKSRAPSSPARDSAVQLLSAQALAEVLNATSSVVAVKDLQGRYIYVNRAFLRLMGGEATAYLGRTDEQIFGQTLADQLRGNDQQVLAERREFLFEETFEFDGQRRVFSTRKYPLLRADGEPWAVCLTAQDITDAKRTDEALHRIALGISAASGPEVFELTVSSVAAVLGVDLAFVAALDETAQPPRLSTLAICSHGQTGGRESYEVAGTPCALVLQRGFEYCSGCAAERFPGDQMLVAAGFVSYAGYPLVNGDGSPVGVLSVCHAGPLPPPAMVESILKVFSVRAAAELEHVRMDRALRASEQSYRTIFEASEDCIFIHDFATGAFVDVNPRACAAYGYDYGTFLKLGPGDLGTGEPPYTEADALQYLQRARDGETVRFEWHRRNADGSTCWDEVCLKHVQLAGVDRILAVTRDITERKEREQAIARSEDRLRVTVEAALDCIVAMDSGGRIRDFNPAAESCFGYRRAEVLGRPLAELIVPERYQRGFQQSIERLLRGEASRMFSGRIELVARRADGSEFPVEVAITEAQGVDGLVLIGYLRDVTAQREAERARRQLEAQLRQAQKMEAIGQLTGGVAHDFNNILTGIMGYLSMAENIARSSGDVTLQRYLERAAHSGKRATELIQQMLAFSRGQPGQPRAASPALLVQDALHLVRATLPASVVLAVDLEDATPPVMFDAIQFEQVLMNLCINARDAMAGQGTIELAVRRVEASNLVCTSCHRPVSGAHVEVRVADSGSGVPEPVLSRMFEPFFSTKKPGQGSGMGLAMVHGLVHEHRGHVLAGNRAEGGARFSLLLPVLSGAAAAEPGSGQNIPAQLPRGAGLSGRVLLVDDDSSVREFMSDLLQAWGLEVASFDSPIAALAAGVSGRRSVDAAILDYTMPYMTGLELARQLRDIQPVLPVLLYSGYAEGLTDAELAEAGVRARLSKPVDPAELFAHLEAMLAPPGQGAQRPGR